MILSARIHVAHDCLLVKRQLDRASSEGNVKVLLAPVGYVYLMLGLCVLFPLFTSSKFCQDMRDELLLMSRKDANGQFYKPGFSLRNAGFCCFLRR
jgi:hypothetical protein